MFLEMDALDGHQRYKLMSAAIVPRPIAWVSSLSTTGIGNVAPYSFFNMMGSSPPLLVLGTMRQADGRLKDTAQNILDTGEFVVNLVGEASLEAMNLTCADAPPDIDEAELAGLALDDSCIVHPKRIVGAPVSFECRLRQHIDAPPETLILIGEVVAMHIDDHFVDPATLRLDPVAMGLVGRVHGPGAYTRIAIHRQLDRPLYADLAKGTSVRDSID
ncbi:MAG: flavin reductase family protein [Sphingomonadaceae bacterium]|nr:flavin reductase family protein [Sphingomonadaceae bacterium]